MDRLTAELQRLFLQPPANGGEAAEMSNSPLPDGGLVLEQGSPDSRQRVFCIAVGRPTDWEIAAAIYRGVQEDLDLPAPLVSVDGQGFHLWFSLAEAIPWAQGQAFLAGLLGRYAADFPASRVQVDTGSALVLPPARLADTERWAAFIDPSMGSMFRDEAWLEMPPNRDQQADLLAGFTSATVAEFERALAQLAPIPAQNDRPTPDLRPTAPEMLTLPGPYADPRSFLLAVMNASNVGIQQRIEAAKALLPYFGNTPSP